MRRLEEGRKAFNRGEFLEAHELWEEVWRELEGEERILVEGLMQVAAGIHQLQRGRPRPATRLLSESLEKFSRCTPGMLTGLGVDSMVQAVERLLKALE